METSLRFRSDEQQLVLHGKEKFVSEGNISFQVHGRVNTKTGKPGGTMQLRKRFFPLSSPELVTCLDVGAKFDLDHRELIYQIQAKKSFEITGPLLTLDLKTGYNFNPGTRLGEPRAVVEVSQKVFNFTEDQDVKIKLGYNVVDKKPFYQIRENNWSWNGDFKGNWNIVYDL
eukprot:TRINITY_DN14621_c0_g1_i1.p1 TRINITY_DN14621_c0_g1~~TRINITY_DN14621_c0_g1_i1.p1  ORF type:complete len:172 (+),score=41.33 TRINITY_DN14621_c0_g1_i1:101-616(+)